MATTYVEGRYLAKVLDQGFGKSESKGTPFFFCQIRILARIGDGGPTGDQIRLSVVSLHDRSRPLSGQRLESFRDIG